MVPQPTNLAGRAEVGDPSSTEQDFIQVLRTGIRRNGAAILPPMPWEFYNQLTDDDLKAIFASLRTILPIKNRVPENLPPSRQ
jgi:hypothetical protein